MENKYEVIAESFSSAVSSKVCYDDGQLRVFGCMSGGAHAVEVAFESVVFVRVGDEGGAPPLVRRDGERSGRRARLRSQ